jgi:MASE9 protein
MAVFRVLDRYRIHALLFSVLAAAAWLLATNQWTLPSDSSSTNWNGIVAFAALAILCDTSFLRLSFANIGSSVAFVPFIASVMLFQHPWPMLISGTTALVVDTFVRKKPPIRISFNTAQYMLAVGLGAEVYRMLGGVTLDGHFTFGGLPFAGLVATYFVVNSGSVALAVAISSGVSVKEAWSRIVGSSLIYDLFASSLAVLLVYLYIKTQLLGLALLVVPLFFVRHMYQMNLQSH